MNPWNIIGWFVLAGLVLFVGLMVLVVIASWLDGGSSDSPKNPTAMAEQEEPFPWWVIVLIALAFMKEAWDGWDREKIVEYVFFLGFFIFMLETKLGFCKAVWSWLSKAVGRHEAVLEFGKQSERLNRLWIRLHAKLKELQNDRKAEEREAAAPPIEPEKAESKTEPGVLEINSFHRDTAEPTRATTEPNRANVETTTEPSRAATARERDLKPGRERRRSGPQEKQRRKAQRKNVLTRGFERLESKDRERGSA